jgi:hypothetical protein
MTFATISQQLSYNSPYTADRYGSLKAIEDDDASILSALETYYELIVAVAPDSAILVVYRKVVAKNFSDFTVRVAFKHSASAREGS